MLVLWQRPECAAITKAPNLRQAMLSCLKCRKGNGVCEFTEYRKEKVIWVQEDCDDPENTTKQTRQTTIKLTQEVEKQLREKMGVNKITTELLRTYLKAKGQRTSGVKVELVTRVIELQQGCDDPMPLALTCTTVVEGVVWGRLSPAAVGYSIITSIVMWGEYCSLLSSSSEFAKTRTFWWPDEDTITLYYNV